MIFRNSLDPNLKNIKIKRAKQYKSIIEIGTNRSFLSSISMLVMIFCFSKKNIRNPTKDNYSKNKKNIESKADLASSFKIHDCN